MLPVQRQALFERMTYFRRGVPDCDGTDAQRRMEELLDAWFELFIRDDYYFATPTFVALGTKPLPNGDVADYAGPLFGSEAGAWVSDTVDRAIGIMDAMRVGEARRGAPAAGAGEDAAADAGDDAVAGVVADAGDDALADAVAAAGGADEPADVSSFSIVPLTEQRLGEVMAIEMRSFPDPWSPLAYAMELRHNPLSTYVALIGADGALHGYAGLWMGEGSATLAHIATDPALRRRGLGHALVSRVYELAREAGASYLQLLVRSSNHAARAFYLSEGFVEVETSPAYYTNPVDDGVAMVRPLGDAGLAPATSAPGGDAGVASTASVPGSDAPGNDVPGSDVAVHVAARSEACAGADAQADVDVDAGSGGSAGAGAVGAHDTRAEV